MPLDNIIFSPTEATAERHPVTEKSDQQTATVRHSTDLDPRRPVPPEFAGEVFQRGPNGPGHRHYGHVPGIDAKPPLRREILFTLLLLRGHDLFSREEPRAGPVLFRSLHHDPGARRLAHHARGVQEVHPRLAALVREDPDDPEVHRAGGYQVYKAVVAALSRFSERVCDERHGGIEQCFREAHGSLHAGS